MTPEDLKYFSSFLSEFQKETDRGAALVGAALIDSRIERLLVSHFVDKKVAKELLNGGSAPLGSFSAKIKLCYALGLITEIEYKECDTIRKIRNEFAHEVHGLTYESQNIKDLCSNLKANTPSGDRSSARSLFINSVVLTSLSLWYRPEYAEEFNAQKRDWKYMLSPEPAERLKK